MKVSTLAAVALLCSTACASVAELDEGDRAVRSISYETTPCFGTCPVYSFTVRDDGRGHFEGRRFTPVTGERDFRVSAEEYGAFARHLEPIRPDAGNLRIEGDTCPEAPFTDSPTVEVSWQHGDGEVQRLRYYYGCAPEHYRSLAQRLGAAPFLLPIGDLIGPR